MELDQGQYLIEAVYGDGDGESTKGLLTDFKELADNWTKFTETQQQIQEEYRDISKKMK